MSRRDVAPALNAPTPSKVLPAELPSTAIVGVSAALEDAAGRATAGAACTVKIDAALNPTASATALSKATNRRRPVPFPPCCIAIVPFRFAQDRSHLNMYLCLHST